MSNTNSKEYSSALKKAISAANQALTLHYALEGLGAQDYPSTADLINEVFQKRMNVMKLEASSSGQSNSRAALMKPFFSEYSVNGENDYGCVPRAVPFQNFFITQDGVLFCIEYFDVGEWVSEENEEDKPCNSYNTVPCTLNGEPEPNLFIDVNGIKTPNRATISSSHPRDQYTAQIYNTKVIPFGKATQEVMYDKHVSTGAD